MPQEPPVKARPTNAELARALNVNISQISRWRKAGCPNNSIEAVREWRRNQPQRKTESQKRPGNSNGLGNNLQKRFARMCPPTPKRSAKLSPELVEQVAKYISNGFTDEETALLCDLEENTIRSWRKLSPVKKAIHQRKNDLIEKVIHGTRPDWARVCWFLERRYPLQFSRPEVAHAIATANITQNNLSQTIVISPSIAKELSERSASVRSEVKKLFDQHPARLADRSAKLLNHDARPEGVTE
jgi:hypothetical protein